MPILSPQTPGTRRSPPARGWLIPLLLAGLALLLSPAAAHSREAEEIWLLVDTQALELRVMRGLREVRVYRDIAIGRAGATQDKRRLDGTTPLGEYRISVIKNDSKFHRFFGIDYPHLPHAERALQRGELAVEDYLIIRNAVRAGRPAPQNTPLGGHLGIHGIGAGEPEVHSDFNWTNGCIALTNEQVEELAHWIRPGTRVVIY
ncbi:MAG: L,D-transpeptidase family protein [Gammaproteobacteria bacterium]